MAIAPGNLFVQTVLLLPAVLASVTLGEEPSDHATSESSLASCIEIGAHSQITTRKDLRVTIRVVGSGFEGEYQSLPVALWVKPRMPCHIWEMPYYGWSDRIDPTTPVGEFDVGEGTTIDLAWRGKNAAGNWLPVGWTLEPTQRVVCLRHGDPFPAKARRGDGTVDDFVARFVREDGAIVLGAREILFLLEMGPAIPGDESPDFRDLAVIVSFHESETPVADSRSSERGTEDRGQPGVKGTLSRFDPEEEYDDVPPVTITLTDLAPGSSSYLRVYRGPPHEDPEETQVVGESYVWNDDSTPQDREFSLKDLNFYLASHGWHTMELIHETAEGSTVLCRSSISVDRTLLPRNGFYTNE